MLWALHYDMEVDFLCKYWNPEILISKVKPAPEDKKQGGK